MEYWEQTEPNRACGMRNGRVKKKKKRSHFWKNVDLTHYLTLAWGMFTHWRWEILAALGVLEPAPPVCQCGTR